ncbi:alkaline phosphatase family protein [Cohnella sp. CFH 77786]|uniref:alkaline phosphatase family protein n=1 Tax=Cohnella sp. CFH 77786 TaxID=2662265 RepID=UPI001C60C8D4|nr:alkaline phosphatase family protein [Cohnella sp. CFH 77786]MBW5446935.1 alkaline phosphatase family protein [Cohnella sp. CFH 77786]
MRYRTTPWFAGALLLAALLFGCAKPEGTPKERDLLRIRSDPGTQASKKVILICIDSLMGHAIDEGIKQNKLPAFRYLIEHGQYYPSVVTSFPTMSVSIDSTMLTGQYPDEHRIPGLVWYSAAEKRMINYGTGPLEIARHGADRMLQDAFIRLNGSHLSPRAPTLFEDLARKGLTSGSVNGLIYRGNSDHLLSLPAWVRVPSSLPSTIKVKGPDFLAFGVFSNPLADKKPLPDKLTDRLGLDNEYALEVVEYLIQKRKLPDFLYVYFPDLDFKIHQRGPADLEGVVRTDRQLEALLQAFGSREEALRKAVIVISGDNGMVPVLRRREGAAVDMGGFLKGYVILKPGQAASDSTEIAVAANDRMAYVYRLAPRISLASIARSLQADPRFDVIAWQDKGWIHVLRGGSSGKFTYRPNGPITDPYRQSWTLAKNPSVLDMTIDDRKHTLLYGRYPDALRKIAAALNSHDGEYMIVTAKPGYELSYGSSPIHAGGGGHGGISEAESLIPLIVAGTDAKPDSLRVVDLKRYFLRVIGGK